MATEPHPTKSLSTNAADAPPYLSDVKEIPLKRFFIETYGCQMNFNDTEVVMGILEGTKQYSRVHSADEADVILLMTCAIREHAESKIWSRLQALRNLEQRRQGNLIVGVLGCMAERLKTQLLEKTQNVDIVCGPDAYRDLPRLLRQADEGIDGINVMLSADETYADIAPIRLDATKKSAFVSIMRGCNNMCAFCIVPFTRGRERSRPIPSIVEEVQRLSSQGVKEITLLGQNVNSYCDESMIIPSERNEDDILSKGFTTIYKIRTQGKRFVDLLDEISLVDPEMRIRFTSPHPKDFPNELLQLMGERPNICKQIHLPAQSGSNAVLERMRRGYTVEAYLDLVANIRSIVPGVSFSSDFIVGFCGEQAEDHAASLRLIEAVGYDMAYMYAYSMREKTMAHRRYVDDVPEKQKQRRLREMIELFYDLLAKRVSGTIGMRELVLVEGDSKKSSDSLVGKSDGGRSIVFPKEAIESLADSKNSSPRVPIPGDYVEVVIESVKGATPIARAVRLSSINQFHLQQMNN